MLKNFLDPITSNLFDICYECCDISALFSYSHSAEAHRFRDVYFLYRKFQINSVVLCGQLSYRWRMGSEEVNLLTRPLSIKLHTLMFYPFPPLTMAWNSN